MGPTLALVPDNTTEDLASKVLKWIKQQGYPLEMSVARAFREVGFSVQQSYYYIDPQKEILREGDIMAWQEFGKGGEFYMIISLFVECKVSKKKPWVIFSSQYDYYGSNLNPYRIMNDWMCSNFNRNALVKDGEIQSLGLFSVPKRLGYGVSDVFLNKENSAARRESAYMAMMQVTNCMIATKRIYLDAIPLEGKKADRSMPICMLFIPIVVIDGRLFESYLDDTNEVVVSEVKTSTISWPVKMGYEASNTYIKILTVDILSDFVQEVNKTMKTLSSNQRIEEIKSRLK